MTDAAVLKSETQDIVVDEVFPHTPETIWKTLTDRALTTDPRFSDPFRR